MLLDVQHGVSADPALRAPAADGTGGYGDEREHLVEFINAMDAVASAAGAHNVVRYRDADAAEAVRAVSAGVNRIVEVSLAANAALDVAVAAQDARVTVYAMDDGDALLSIRPSVMRGLTYRFMLIYHLAPDALEVAAATVEHAVADGVLDLPPSHGSPSRTSQLLTSCKSPGRSAGCWSSGP